MDKKSKNTLIVSVIALALVLIGVTYAYFSARITGLESASTITLTAGRMSILYTEGDENVIMDNIYPREEAWVTKTFTLTAWNTTNLDLLYSVGLDITANGFADGYLTYDLTLVSSTNGTPISTKSDQPLNGTGSIELGTGTFTNANGDSHNYELKIYFKDNGLDQNDAQEAGFSAKIYVEEGFDGPFGWKNAQNGTLLAGIKSNNPTLSSTFDSAADDYGTSFYYKGAVDNNFVVFAGMCWRIVRVDGAGNVKLVLYNYETTEMDNPCDESLDGQTKAFARLDPNDSSSYTSKFNTNKDYPTYIGYMYSDNPSSEDYEEAYANDNDSVILTNLKSWYDRVFTRDEEAQLVDVIWCNDKRIVTNATYNPFAYSDPRYIYYQSSYRVLYDNGRNQGGEPSLKCGDDINDNTISKFTASALTDGGYGNHALNGHRVGLLTADEVALAGGEYNYSNTTYYLYKNANEGNNTYWTLSPLIIYISSAYNFIVNGNGALFYGAVNAQYGIRPVIAVRGSIGIISGGTGTQSNPFNIAAIDDNSTGR